jgi:hypothetical protein
MTWLNLQDFESDHKYLKEKGLGIEGLNINCMRLKTQVSQNFNVHTEEKNESKHNYFFVTLLTDRK